MKRTFYIVVCICLLLSGCSGTKSNTWQPSIASDEIKPYAKRAIEIIDGYLNFRMSSEEASEAFRELRERIDPLDVRDVDSEYSETDQTIAYNIEMLATGKAKNKTDVEYHLYRDTLAFYIGEPVSGKTYAAEQDVYNYIFDANGKLVKDPAAEEKLSKFINIKSVPFSHGSADDTDGYWDISLDFDQKHGVSVSSLQKYIKDVYDVFVTKDITNASIFVCYERFEQPVFCIYLCVSDDIIYGSVNRNDAPYEEAFKEYCEKYTFEERMQMEEYPKEFAILNPLYEFSDIEYLPEALKVASAFAGVE